MINICVTLYVCLSVNIVLANVENNGNQIAANAASKNNELSAKITDFAPDTLSNHTLNSSAATCYCGKNSIDCEYKDGGRKVCSCQPGYAAGDLGFCVDTCNETQTCRNGGSCLNHVCVCLPGTTGPFCETVIDCDERKHLCGKDEDTTCYYNVKQQKARCRCRVNEHRFDDLTRTCKSCLCSPTFSQDLSSFTYCEYRHGEKKCFCAKNYAYEPILKICQRCNCGPNSDWCEFDESGNKICGCKEGYLQSFYDCQKCPKECGKHGQCEKNRDGSFFYNFCICDPGYAEYKGKCVECTCGKYGQCVFNEEGIQVSCKCTEGYAEKSGVCEMCDCGENSNCTFKGQVKVCICSKGYEDINGFCTDINECEKHNPCKKSTKCINLLGGFKCVCDDGYMPVIDSDEETYVEFCKDVDECKNATFNVCPHPNAYCVNTQGSYDCVCHSGYFSRGGTGTSIVCEKTSSVNIYSLVFITAASTLFTTGGIVLYAQRNLLRRR